MNNLLTRRAAFLSVAILVFGLVLVYPAQRLLHWSGYDHTWSVGFGLFFWVVATRILHERVHSMLTRRLTAITMTWLGISFIALCLTLLGEIWLWIGNDPVTTAEVIGWTCALLSAYGFYNAQRLHTYVLDINAPDAAKGISFAQISDVHIGSRLPGFLARVVRHTNELHPDYVLITGDLIDMRDISEDELLPLQQLRAPILFCIGNHERYVDLEAICQRLTNLGVNVLRNTVHQPDQHPQLVFFSVDDAESKDQVSKVLPELVKSHNHRGSHADQADEYRILLYHRPDGADVASEHCIDLMLTGHTHRGQIMPFNFLVKRVFPQYYRSYLQNYTRLYVSPGTGTWGPTLRLGSKCEITLIRLL